MVLLGLGWKRLRGQLLLYQFIFYFDSIKETVKSFQMILRFNISNNTDLHQKLEKFLEEFQRILWKNWDIRDGSPGSTLSIAKETVEIFL